MEFSRKSHYFLTLFAIFLLAILVRIICFSGLIGGDDLTYNRAAYALSANTFSAEYAHRETRLGLPLLVAPLFRLFGVQEWSSAIVPFASFILTFWVLVYMATSLWGHWTGLMAGLLYTFLPIEMYYATILLPDLPSSACVALSSALLYQSERRLTNAPESSHSGFMVPIWLLSFIGGMALGWAYLIRETAIFFGIFAAGYMVYLTWRDRAIRWTRLIFWGGVLLVVGFELGFFSRLTGNPLYRYMAIEYSNTPETMNDLRRYFYVPMPIYIVLDRFRALFWRSDFGFHYFFITMGIVYGFRKRFPSWGYVAGWFLTVYGLYSFGSTSLTQYAPLRTVPRYFLALSVPGILIMAKFLEETRVLLGHHNKKDTNTFLLSWAVPTLILLILTVLWFSTVNVLFLLGMGLLCAIISIAGLRNWLRTQIPQRYTAALLPITFLYISLLPGIYATTRGDVMRNRVAYERQVHQFFGTPLLSTIYTDERTANVLQYFYQYQADENILSFTDVDMGTLKDTFVIANWERLFFLNRLYEEPIPDFLTNPPSQWGRIAKIGGEVNPCLIYKIP